MSKRGGRYGIMQPYFFPYLGYFQLINAVDHWVIFDVVQYIRHQWINRNRILHPTSGWQYIIVPLRKHSREVIIKDIEISDSDNWKNKILGQLEHYKKTAPYYSRTMDIVRECLLGGTSNTTNLVQLNTVIIDKLCQRLNIPFNYSICSEMDLIFDEIASPGDWALRLSQKLNASEYINPYSGKGIFDKHKFEESGIQLKFLRPNLRQYRQKEKDFHEGLSIIDVMMWNSEEEIATMIDDYALVSD